MPDCRRRDRRSGSERKPLMAETEFYVGSRCRPRSSRSSTRTTPRGGTAYAGAEPAVGDRPHQCALRPGTGTPQEAVGRCAARFAGTAPGGRGATARSPWRRPRHPRGRPTRRPRDRQIAGAARLRRASRAAARSPRRIGLAPARLHRLPDEGVERLLLAGAELLDRLRVGRRSPHRRSARARRRRASGAGRGRRSGRRRRRRRRFQSASKTWRAAAFEIVRRRCGDQGGQRPGGADRRRWPLALSRRDDLAHDPVGDQLRLRPGLRAAASKYRRSTGSASSSPRHRRCSLYSLWKRRPSRGQLRHAPRTRRSSRRRSPAAAGRGRGNSGSRGRLPSCACPRLAVLGVEQHGRLLDATAVLDQVDLPLHFVVDRLLHEAEAVQVLDLAPGTERRARPRTEHWRRSGSCPPACCRRRCRARRRACAAPARTRRPRARAHVGLGDDLEQRRAGAVQVDAGPVAG